MKALQWLATAVLVLAGIVLVRPVLSQTAAKAAFVPTRFTVTDSGTAGKPDVLLIPGLSSSKAVWDHEAELLGPNYRLHVVQVDGFAGAPAGGNAGASSANPMLPAIVEELHQYIATVGMKPVVVGHSLGGLLTLMLADKYPGDARKLIIVDALPFYGLVFNPAATVENVKPQADAIAQQMLAMPDDQFVAMQPMMVGAMVRNVDAQKLVAASSVASDRRIFVEAMAEDLQTDLRGDMAKIQTPTLLLYPYDATFQKDEAKYDAVYKTSYAGMPHVTMMRVDDSRHFIMYDQPERFDAAVQAFIK
ncbi:alpha/beta fold hydrolase [Granulicella paludicola]|uniref:alpha/beta fold hydrolase n=1 Tax=Granulicella paludicola TaxID=474951 RepID=UPI0021DF8913|nr:alpha/beta hydrolase [Granulicella paludicola]